MFFLNLTAGEFFVLLGTLAGLITTLYLLDRMKRRKIVSTLRFWRPAVTADEQQSRKRMREPWSFVLQLLSMLLLLLAIAQLQWGVRQRRSRNHILLLDTSAWTGERAGQGTVLDREKDIARQYLAGLGTADRVMVVRADNLAIPVVPFTSDHGRLEQAVNESASGFSALNLEQALSFASQAQAGSGGPGEIVYIGPGLAGNMPKASDKIPNLRVIGVDASRSNCGVRRIGARPTEGESGSWDATVTLKNYGAAARRVRLRVQFAGTAFAPRSLDLPAHQEKTVEYAFETNAAGVLAAEIEPHDDLPQDDRAEIWLHKNRALRLAVYTRRPDILRPLLEANRRLSITIASPSEYNPKPQADVMLLDEMSAPLPPQIPCLWIAPPEAASPLKVRALINKASIKTWDSTSVLGAALYAKETQLPVAEVFDTVPGDLVAGTIKEGAVVVARPESKGHAKLAIIGFDPLSTELRFQVTTPLLAGGLIRWLSPQAFRPADVTADRVGAVTVSLDPGERIDSIHVRDAAGSPIPFTARDHTLQLFTARPGIVKITSEDHNRILSLTLPEIADAKWAPPAEAAEGLPPAMGFLPSAVDLWKWLAILGAAGLALEWMLYGRRRRAAKNFPAAASAAQRDRIRELVSR
jgi:hypothetical protein